MVGAVPGQIRGDSADGGRRRRRGEQRGRMQEKNIGDSAKMGQDKRVRKRVLRV